MDKKGKENINVSERQERPLRQVWGNQSNFHPPGLEWKFPNFSSMGWDIASDLPLLSQAGWGSHGLHPNCGLHVWKEETQQSVRRINLSWVCNTSQVPAWLQFPPTLHRSPMEENPAVPSRQEARSLQTRVPPSHQSHRVSWSARANEAFEVNGWKVCEILARTPVPSCAQ